MEGEVAQYPKIWLYMKKVHFCIGLIPNEGFIKWQYQVCQFQFIKSLILFYLNKFHLSIAISWSEIVKHASCIFKTPLVMSEVNGSVVLKYLNYFGRLNSPSVSGLKSSKSLSLKRGLNVYVIL